MPNRSFLLLPALLLSFSMMGQEALPVQHTKSPAQVQAASGHSVMPTTAGHNRYGFHALYEVRMSPGIIKVLDIRQYYVSETQAVQAFMKVQASVPPGAMLKSVQWFGPTGGSGSLGD